MTYEQVYKKIENNAEKIIFRNAQTFNADIVSAWAVGTPESTGVKGYVGGTSKAAWSMVRNSPLEVRVYNHINYAGILFMGRVGNRGSYQMPNGGYPILKKAIINLKKDLKRNTL